MYPHSIDLHFAGLSIHLYGVMMALGFLAGLFNWWLLGRRAGRDFAFCSDLLFWIIVSGIVGGRIAYVAANWSEFRPNPLSALAIWQGGLVFYGGLLGAAAALLVFARQKREKTSAVFDFVVTSLPLAHAFGRIGCFLNGCCYGKPWHGWLAVSYPTDSQPWCDQVEAGLITRFQPRSAPVHPVQLYEAAINLVIFGVLLAAYRHRRRDGWVTALYLLTYPAVRLWLETFRGDARIRWPDHGLSLAQWLSLALMALGASLLYRALRQPARGAGAQPASPS